MPGDRYLKLPLSGMTFRGIPLRMVKGGIRDSALRLLTGLGQKAPIESRLPALFIVSILSIARLNKAQLSTDPLGDTVFQWHKIGSDSAVCYFEALVVQEIH